MSGAYRTLIGPTELQAGVSRLAGEISAAYDDGVVLVAVLKGSVPFLADLVRSLTVVPVIEFMAISAYAPDTGRVRIVMDTEVDLYGRQVVLIEDIVDTGLTLTYLLGQLRGREAASVDACALLDKSVRRIVPTPLRFRGFEIGDEFVLGYGLDYAERYRNLDRIVAADLGLLRSDPDSYVDAFYPSGTSPSRASVCESRD
ncbi:MAG TPA: hypoxanthine phosphoribosyltransferase [Acidimicrobiales bacterium]|nr:hypoxanthine phosphoribosyltransferase [Acidimicrobiales bacterium]